GGLAAAAFADKPQCLAFSNEEAYVIYRLDIAHCAPQQPFADGKVHEQALYLEQVLRLKLLRLKLWCIRHRRLPLLPHRASRSLLALARSVPAAAVLCDRWA